MNATQPLNPSTDYTRFLRDKLEERIRNNARYSLRSFARDIGVAAPNLSLILRNKKGLSIASASRVAMRLGLSDDDTSLFCDIVALKHARSKSVRRILELRLARHETASDTSQSDLKSRQLTLDAFRVISDWYHYALLELSLTKNFRSEPGWIAKKLGISIHEVNSAIERLQKLDLLLVKNGVLVKKNTRVLTTDGVPSEAIRKFTRQVLSKAIDALTEQKIEERDFTTMTFAGNPKKLKEAAALVRRCRDQVVAKLEEGEATDVLSFSTQIFRLSHNKENL